MALKIEIPLKVSCIILFHGTEVLTIFHTLMEMFYDLGAVVRFEFS